MGVDLGVILTVGGALLAGGAAYGAVRQAVSAMARQLAEHVKADEVYQRDTIARLTRIETILTERK